MINLTWQEWRLISNNQKYEIFTDLRYLGFNIVDFLMNNKIYRVIL